MMEKTDKQHSKQGKAVGSPRQPGASKGEAESHALKGPYKEDYKAADSSSDIPTLFLDGELRIRFFTPVTTRILKLIPSDTGRTISDLSMNFIGYELTSE